MSDTSNNRLISLEGVSVVFDRNAVLRDVDLTVNAGDFMAISGPNGGGKTTLLKVILKLLKPTKGSVEYFNHGSHTSRLAIGYLPQKSNIDTRFPVTVEEVVKSGELKGFSRRKENGRYEEIVGLMGIGDYLDRQIGALSGGQLQRTLLGRALMTAPEILVLDEPLSYVDKQFEHQIYSIMENLSKSITIVLVSHEMSVISGMANRHIIVDHTLRECVARTHYKASECDDHHFDGTHKTGV